ncbi:DNA-binding domain-containing protein [Pseudomonas sp. MWU12-2319]|uniref:conjugal transfer nickase/helicase domain-containing protein n=1 Tax=unclassified Pseudomonas TaxID=196821 RepID=UPI00128E484F|nr:hypothetical protein [Pseudomonas sp. MWU12-2323]
MPSNEGAAQTTDHQAAFKSSAGMQFVGWIREGLKSERLRLNEAKALLHTVDGTVFLVSPGLFQRYAQEHPAIAREAKREGTTDWQWIQKRFEQLNLHRKQPSDLNIWTCEVLGPNKGRRLHGYLMIDPRNLVVEVTFNNPYLKLLQYSEREKII